MILEPLLFIFSLLFGEMAEWSKALVSKTSKHFRVSGVQIPLSPPSFKLSIKFFIKIKNLLNLIKSKVDSSIFNRFFYLTFYLTNFFISETLSSLSQGKSKSFLPKCP